MWLSKHLKYAPLVGLRCAGSTRWDVNLCMLFQGRIAAPLPQLVVYRPVYRPEETHGGRGALLPQMH